MSISSPCEICHEADAEHTCDRCGRLVCPEHYDETLGLCTECAGAVREGSEPDHIPDGEDMPDGVDTYRF